MKSINHFVFVGGLALSLALAARAQLTNFTTIDYPSSTATGIIGLNDGGDMVGFYTDRDNRTHGFLLKDGKFTSLDPPGSTSAQGFDINAAGDIVGFFTDAN